MSGEEAPARPGEPVSRTYEEALAVLLGENLDDFRKQQALRAEIRAASEHWIEAPPERWPPLFFNWDRDPANHRFALDGLRAEDFPKHYPSGLQAAWVDVEALDAVLCAFNRRAPHELWSVGSRSKLAYVIEYVARGLPITPVLIAPHPEGICFHGGNHRYAAARASGQLAIPVLFAPDHQAALSRCLPLRSDPPA